MKKNIKIVARVEQLLTYIAELFGSAVMFKITVKCAARIDSAGIWPVGYGAV